MKSIYLMFLFALFGQIIYSQEENLDIRFDDSTYLNYVIIDTTSNPNNIWQVGEPNKLNFTSAYSYPNAIITDTLYPYPNNDTSSFYIRYLPDLYPAYWQSTNLQIRYRIDSDFDSDFGYIEFSPDNGQTWVNYMTDSIYNSCYYAGETYFTGFSENWDWTGYNNDPWCFNMNWDDPDTIIYKFTFISDSSQVSERDGWMLDNLSFYDIFENIEDNTKTIRITIYPNPAKSKLYVISDNSIISKNVNVYNQSGQLIGNTQMVDNSITVSGLQSGLYIIGIMTDKGEIRRKFIIRD